MCVGCCSLVHTSQRGIFRGSFASLLSFSKNVSRFVEVIVERRTKTFAVLVFFAFGITCVPISFIRYISKKGSPENPVLERKKIHLEYIERVRERETGKYYASFSPNISNTTEEMEEGRKNWGKGGTVSN